MSQRNQSPDAVAVQAARFRVFSLIATAAAVVGVGLGAVETLWGISIAAGATAVLILVTYLWSRRRPERTVTGMRVSLYGSTLGLAIMSFFELPDASTLPFFMAIIVLAGSYLLGVSAALWLTVVASASVLVCYLAFAWAAANGWVPDSGYAIIGVADVPELLTMALRRSLFLFAVFGMARAARRTLDNQLAVVADREETIEVQSAELRTSQQHFLTLAQGVPVGILETDFDSKAEFVNRAWCELASVPEQDSLGHGWMKSVEPDDLHPLLQVMENSPAPSQPGHPQELSDHIFRIRRPDGDLRWVTGRVAPLLAEDGSVKGHITAAIDVTSQRTASEQLEYLATHDPMTGILNRGAFELEAGSALLRADRYSGRCALLFADVDDFKFVNDTYGHAVGDATLDTVVRRMQSTLREVDTIGRLGGDEFGILMDEVRTREDAALTIRHIQAVMREPIVINNDISFTLGLSVGAAVYPDDGATFDALARRADSEMYRAKKHRGSYPL
jgi:diguanylate cyclase (GGDEF)-like protein/PAS domain S-box-containing protein